MDYKSILISDSECPTEHPEELVELVNHTLGFGKEKETVYYLHNGSPIFCHLATDLNNYRYITASLVEHGFVH